MKSGRELSLARPSSSSEVGCLSTTRNSRVDRLDAVDQRHQHLPGGVGVGPALDRGDAILRRDRRAVMPLQAVAQREDVGLPVLRLGPAGHLRLHLEMLVGAQQRVVDHVAVVARHERGGHHRVQHPQPGLHHGRDRLRLDLARPAPAPPPGPATVHRPLAASVVFVSCRSPCVVGCAARGYHWKSVSDMGDGRPAMRSASTPRCPRPA